MRYSQNKKEKFNYCLNLIVRPKLLFKGLGYFLKKLLQIIERKLATAIYYYPRDIKRAAKECLNSKIQIKWLPPVKSNHDLNIDSLSAELTLQLASITLKSEEAKEPWNIEFEDEENLMALHRWNWLLTTINNSQVNKKQINKNLELLEEWVDKFTDKKEKLIWDSYSTGERICNSLLFYWVIRQAPSKKILNAIGSFVEYLIKHLEYRGQNTNNHIINNARAIYFAGCFLGVKQWQNLAQLIFKRELPKLITSDGFLREGSSHYHFLFTRWILEVLWLAEEKGDDDFLSFLEPFASQLVKQCWFFLVWNQDEKKWSIPLIGDVSPDFTPDWLLSVPWSKIAWSVFQPETLSKGPSNGWGNLLVDRQEETEEINSENKNFEYKNSGWYRFDNDNLTLFIRVKPDETLSYPAHDHNDLGSFCLYIKGLPVFIDPGRLNYILDNLSQCGISAKAHNSILVNGFEPTPFFKKRFAVKEYMMNNPEVMINKLNNDIVVRLRFHGFERLVNKRVTITRQFHLSKNRLVIEDFFAGKGFRNIEANFHFSPNIKIEQNENIYDLTGPFGKARFIVEQGLQKKIIEDWYFPEYGKKQISKTLVVNKDINLSCKINYQLSWL